MELGQRGIDLIKEFEELRLTAYPDQGGVWTIGWGTIRYEDGTRVKRGDVITEARAVALFKRDAARFVDAVNSGITVPLTQNQFDALVCFSYNVGDGGFRMSSLRKAINARQPIAEDLFTRWNKVRDPETQKLVVSRGLTRRRKAEYQLFMS